MLRPMRYSQKHSLSNSLNFYANQNLFLLTPSQEPTLFFPTNRKDRIGLTEITSNFNTSIHEKFKNDQTVLSKGRNNQKDNRQQLFDRNSQNGSFFNKINELIKEEQTGVSVCHSIKHKRYGNCKERPYTSLSNRNKKWNEQASFHKWQVVLDLTHEPSQQIMDQSKISTSRALMNFSKVYRNSSKDRFKVKRDKQNLAYFAVVSAQKLKLQEKEKRQKKQCQQGQKRIFRPVRKRSQRQIQRLKPRKQVQQQFRIEGWEYFE